MDRTLERPHLDGAATGTQPRSQRVGRAGGSTLYASGFFTAIGNTNVQYLAKWNGSSWSAVGTDAINGIVTGVAFDQSNRLFIRGDFTAIGSLTVNNIARWNGTTWSSLGGGTNSGGAVNDMIRDGGDGMYVSGSFYDIGGVRAPRVAHWNGTTWSAVGADFPGFDIAGGNGMLTGLTRTNDGTLYAGGYTNQGGGAAAGSVARLDGNAWTVIGNATYEVTSMGSDTNGLVYAGGGFGYMGDVEAYSLAVWDGSRWNAPTGGADAPVQVCTTAPDGTMYIGGGFTRIAGREIRGVAKWSGSEWVEVGGGVSGSIYCMTTDAQGRLYIGGFLSEAGGTAINGIARWNGTSWDTFAGGVGGMASGEVYAITVASNGTVYAGGAFSSVGATNNFNHIASWNGTAWSKLGQGLIGADFWSWPPVSDLVIDAQGGLYAGGGFATAGGIAAKRLARWNGTTWSAVGGGITGTAGTTCSVYSLAVDGAGGLLVGGYFTTAGTVPAQHLARWNGTTWQGFTTAAGGYVTNMEKDELGNVFVSGAFTTIDDIPLNGIGRWSQNTWTSLGSGANYTVNDVAIDTANHRLLAVGEFTRAGGKSSHRIGVYDLNATTPAGVAPVLTQNAQAVQASAPGRTVQLTVQASDDEGAGNLTYTWELEEFAGPTPVSFSPNGTKSAKTCTATCAKVGWYRFKVTVRDSDGLSVTSSVSLEVLQHPGHIEVSPGSFFFLPGTNAVFNARIYDQFGDIYNSHVDFTWSASGGGQFTSPTSTVFVAGQTPGGPHIITATGLGITGTATATICPPFAANIDFQPAQVATDTGYLPDSGRVFGARGNGMSYGWNIDISDTARDRNDPAASYQRYDTLLHMQKPGKNATWQIAVPNGWYDVFVMCGDPSYWNSTYRLNVEGVLAVNQGTSSGNLWGHNTVRVLVQDGRLTVSNATGAVNNKICFIEIIAVPAAGG